MVIETVSHVEYSHLRPGTPERRWVEHPRWQGAGDAADLLRGVSRIVVLSAHPDDETLGAGGLAASAHDLGLSVHLVLATDGEASHPGSPTLTPAELGRVRLAEYDAAIALLTPGARKVRLGLPDGALHAHRPALEHALRATLRAPATGSTGDGPGRVLLVAPWRGDGHGDHEAAGAAAVAAAAAAGPHVEIAEYPIWLWHWGDPSDVPWERTWTFRLPEPVRRAKAAAIRAHRSQVAPLSSAPGDEPILHAAALAHFARPFEVFFGGLVSGP